MAMKKKSISKAVREQNKRIAAVWDALHDSAMGAYGCLLPQGEITLSVILPWTREEILGDLKRSGKIVAWAWDKTYEDGNNRQYNVRLNTNKL